MSFYTEQTHHGSSLTRRWRTTLRERVQGLRSPERRRELYARNHRCAQSLEHPFEQRRAEMGEKVEQEVSSARRARKLRGSTRRKGLPKVVTWMALLGMGLFAMQCGLYTSASTGTKRVTPPPYPLRRVACCRPLRADLTRSLHTLRGSAVDPPHAFTHICAGGFLGCKHQQ